MSQPQQVAATVATTTPNTTTTTTSAALSTTAAPTAKSWLNPAVSYLQAVSDAGKAWSSSSTSSDRIAVQRAAVTYAGALRSLSVEISTLGPPPAGLQVQARRWQTTLDDQAAALTDYGTCVASLGSCLPALARLTASTQAAGDAAGAVFGQL